MSVKTINTGDVVSAANDVRDTSQINNVVAANLKKGKKNLADLLDDDFTESLSPVNGKLDIISNFKVECATVETVEENGEQVIKVGAGTGQVIQIQMRMGTGEIGLSLSGKLRLEMGGKLFEKLFEERSVFETIDDFNKFFGSLSEDTLKKAVKIGNKGELKIEMAELPSGTSGVTGALKVFPKAGFLDKVSALPEDVREKVWPDLESLIVDRVSPTIVVGNRPEDEAKKTKK